MYIKNNVQLETNNCVFLIITDNLGSRNYFSPFDSASQPISQSGGGNKLVRLNGIGVIRYNTRLLRY